MLSSFFYSAATLALVVFTTAFMVSYSLSSPFSLIPMYVFIACGISFALGTTAAILYQIRGR